MTTKVIDDRLLTVMEFAALLNVKVSTMGVVFAEKNQFLPRER